MFDKHKGNRPSAQEEPAKKTAPPMSSTPSASSATTESVAMIGEGISVTGDVNATSNLMVGGVIEGRSVSSSQNVEVAEAGIVKASISAKEVRISGQVAGDISGSEKVLITRTGRVKGNIVSPRVQLDDGALFRGSIDMNPGKAAGGKPAQPAAVPEARPAATGSPGTGSKPLGTDAAKDGAQGKKAG